MFRCKKCPKCGKTYADDSDIDHYCTRCNVKLVDATEEYNQYHKTFPDPKWEETHEKIKKRTEELSSVVLRSEINHYTSNYNCCGQAFL